MVGKVKTRRRDRADWELLTRLYEAGTTAIEIANRTGHTERWVRNRIRLCRGDTEPRRARFHAEAVRRELVRAEHTLLEGQTDAAIKQMRALTMLVKLEKELASAAADDGEAVSEAQEIDSAQAELERRFARLRRAHGLQPVARRGADGGKRE
jgi:predicted transcriptional regulator